MKIFAGLLFGFVSVAYYKSVHRESGQSIVVTGVIDAKQIRSFLWKYAMAPTTSIVKFQDCIGGEFRQSVNFASLIRRAGFYTFAEREVSSGCHLAFMAGKNRTISTDGRVVMLVHSPHIDGTLAPKAEVDEFIDALRRLSDRKFPGSFLPYVLATHDNGSGVYFISEVQEGKQVQFAIVCFEKQSDGSQKCRRLGDVSFDELGITYPPINKLK